MAAKIYLLMQNNNAFINDEAAIVLIGETKRSFKINIDVSGKRLHPTIMRRQTCDSEIENYADDAIMMPGRAGNAATQANSFR